MVECYQAFESGLVGLTSTPVTAPLLTLTHPFLSSDESTRTKAYKGAIYTLQRVHGYTAGADTSIRETAAQVQRDHRDTMFY